VGGRLKLASKDHYDEETNLIIRSSYSFRQMHSSA